MTSSSDFPIFASPLQLPGLLSRRAQLFWGFDKVTWTSNIPKIVKISFASCFLDTLILKILGILGWHPQVRIVDLVEIEMSGDCNPCHLEVKRTTTNCVQCKFICAWEKDVY